MLVEVIRRKVLVRVIYLAGATLLTCSLLLEGIFIRLLLVPYLRESTFQPTTCVLRDTFYPTRELQRCESRCAKVASAFPCLIARVKYLGPNGQTWKNGHLFDQMTSYEKRQPHWVSQARPFTYLKKQHLIRITLSSCRNLVMNLACMADERSRRLFRRGKSQSPSSIHFTRSWLGFNHDKHT